MSDDAPHGNVKHGYSKDPEYGRGYNDCLRGHDPDSDNPAYIEGYNAAEKMGRFNTKPAKRRYRRRPERGNGVLKAEYRRGYEDGYALAQKEFTKANATVKYPSGEGTVDTSWIELANGD
jgi:hypothetical protein